MKRVGVHNLRHGMAVVVRKTSGIYAAAKQLGHTVPKPNLGVTHNYAQLNRGAASSTSGENDRYELEFVDSDDDSDDEEYEEQKAETNAGYDALDRKRVEKAKAKRAEKNKKAKKEVPKK